ncbi:MAG: hypothetical protein ABH816_01005 [Candidatus Levyibacteriota bacterium]
MNALFENIKSDKILFWGFLIAVFLLLLNLVFILFSYSSLPPFLPIFNQMPWGEKRLGVKLQIFLPLAITFCIFVLNLFLSSSLYKKMPLLSRILALTTFLICFFSLLFSARTIILII